MNFSQFESEFAGALSTARAEMVAFAAKVKAAIPVVIADVDAAIKAIVSHAGEINTVMSAINANLPQVLAVAQSAGASPGQLKVLQEAAAAATDAAAGLNAASASLNAGSGDVGAVMSAVTATAKASGSTSAVIHALATLRVPVETQAVSPASPSED